MRKHYQVCAAVIEQQGRILCVRRGAAKYDYVAYKYEFPGGKIEPGEQAAQALQRELAEELNVQLLQWQELMLVEHDYEHFSISMQVFVCSADLSKLALHEHIDLQWLGREQLHQLDWAAADLPIVARLQQR